MTPTATGPTFSTVVTNVIAFFDGYVIPLLYALAFLFFLIGVVRYFFMGGDENRQKARPFVLWGLVGLVVIFAIWGIVRLLLSSIPGASA